MESQPQNPEFRSNPDNFHPWLLHFRVPEKENIILNLEEDRDEYSGDTT